MKKRKQFNEDSKKNLIKVLGRKKPAVLMPHIFDM